MSVPLVCLLLSCAVALSGAAVIQEGGLPILWGHTTANVLDFIDEGEVRPDPWHFLHRMSFYRILLDVTDNFMSSMGPGPAQSPMWGLPLQLGWMLTSVRLANPTGPTVCTPGTDPAMCISPNSWWACVNYFSSVLPFLSAAKSGFLGEGISITMKSPPGVEGYCTTYDTCKAMHPQAMENWDAFFQGLVSLSSSPLPVDEKKDTILGLYWNAALASTHASIYTAVDPPTDTSSICNEMKNSYSSVEKAFADSWLSAGEYVAAANFKSNLSLAIMFMAPLPGRVLKDDDSPPNIPDLSVEENRTLNIFSWMKSAERLLGGNMVSYWRNVMCSKEMREKGREMLTQLLFNPTYATTTFLTTIPTLGCS